MWPAKNPENEQLELKFHTPSSPYQKLSQTYVYTHASCHVQTDGLTDGRMCRQTAGHIDEGADRPRGRQTKGQTDRQTEDEQRSEQTDKQTETDLRLLARGLRTSTGVPSSSVITMLLVDSARKCLLRRRKSSHVGVVGSYRKVTWYSWSKVGSNTTIMMLKRQSSSVHQTFIMLISNSSVLKATQSYHKTPSTCLIQHTPLSLLLSFIIYEWITVWICNSNRVKTAVSLSPILRQTSSLHLYITSFN